MSAIGRKGEGLAGKLLLSTALVMVSAGYGYWQKTLETPRPGRSLAAASAARSPMPAKTAVAPAPANMAAAAPSGSGAAPDSSASVAAPADTAAPVIRRALADKPAAAAKAAGPDLLTPTPLQEGPASAAIAMPAGMHLEDGEYTSQHEDFEWGTVQVKAVIKNGAFTDIQFLQIPDHRPHSAELSDLAKPILTHEAIHDQKSAVDIVSTATYTSMAYQDAMADVIVQATRQ